jgi:hypothetical protein
MRDLFIGLLEKVIHVIVVIAAIGIVIAAIAALFNAGSQMGMPGGGVLAALGILIGGGLYLIMVAGFMYLGLGIYQNTKRTAELLEQRR